MINLPNPQSKKWQQDNSSDLFGNVHITKNITFDTQGYLRLSYSPRAIMNETIDAQWDNPAVIVYNSDYEYFVATWDSIFSADQDILSTYPTEIATSGVPTTDIETDAVISNGQIVVSQDTDVDYYDLSANTWTDTNISLTANGQHQVANFLSLSAVAIANVNTVGLYVTPLTATPTLITTLTINSDFEITGMCYFNQFLYVVTQNIHKGKAVMYVWNGSGTSASQVYEVDSTIIYSICHHKGSVYITIGNGSLLMFNGGGFDVVGAFPIYYSDQATMRVNSVNFDMYKNTLKSNGEYLYILFSNSGNSNNLLLDQPDGLWCFDENIGLYHKYALSNSLVRVETVTTASVNTTTDQITVANNYVTGTELYYKNSGGTSITELTNDSKYYAINVDSTHIQLATTLANALAGTEIDLTGTGNNAQKFIFFPNVDYGQYFTNRCTALLPIMEPTNSRQYGTDIIWGAEIVRRDSVSTDYGTLGSVSNSVESRGYFITPKIFSNQITDTFNIVTLKFSPLKYEQDKIIIKYRTEDDMRQYIDLSEWSITWTSTTTFTTTQAEWANAVVGDEVEILQGAGGGLLAHISTITENAGTYTVTLDDTFDNYVSGDVGIAVFRNWIKWETIEYGDNNAENYFLSQELGAEGKFLQLKIELRGVQVRIEELSVDNKYHLPSSN